MSTRLYFGKVFIQGDYCRTRNEGVSFLLWLFFVQEKLDMVIFNVTIVR